MKTKKTKRPENTELGQSMIEGMREAVAFMRGEKNGCIEHHVHIPKKIDVKAIRRRARMSQDQFAKNYGFSKRTLEHWEQGRRLPTGASRAFLTVIAREPEAVTRALMD
jgi:putative transcriptional regulator